MPTLRELYQAQTPKRQEELRGLFSQPLTEVETAGQPGLLRAGIGGVGNLIETLSKSRPVQQGIWETAGGVVGGGLGALAGPAAPVAVPLGIAGGAYLGHLGESAAAKFQGREPRTSQEIALEGTTAGLLEPMLGAAGEVVGRGVRAGADKLAKKALGGPPEVMQRNLQAFEQTGAPLSVGPISGRSSTQQIQETMTDLVGAAGTLRAAAEDTNTAMAKYIAKQASRGKEMPESPYMAGEVAKKGLEAGKRAFKIKSKQLFNELERVVPKNTPVEPDNFVSAIHKPMEKFAGTEYEAFASDAIDSPIFQKWAKKLESGAIKNAAGEVIGYKPMTWEQMKELRSAVGAKLSQPMLTPDVNRAQLNMLYSSISQDMREAAVKAGGEPAGEAFDAANNYYKGGIDTIRKEIDKKLEMDSQRLFEFIDHGTVKDINKFRSFMPAQHWEEVRSQSAVKLGMSGKVGQTGEENFSPLTFLRRWDKELSPQKKEALFGKYRNAPSLVEDLDTVAKAAESIKDMKSFTNPPRTAATGWTIYLLGGIIGAGSGATATGGDPQGALTGLVAGSTLAAKAAGTAWSVAQIMTNPKFVKWLAQANRYNVKTNGFANHIGRLAGMEFPEGEEAVKETIVDTYNSLKEQWGPLTTFEKKSTVE